MDLWNKIPFIRLIVPLILGVISELIWGLNSLYILDVGLIFTLLSLFVFFYKYNIKYRWLFGGLVYVSIYFLSFSLAINNREINDEKHLSNYLEYGNKYIARIIDAPVEKEKSIQLRLEILKILNDSKIDVNGDNAHPLFKFLTTEKKGLLGTEKIKWNFTKFLINKDGEPVNRYGSSTTPEQIETDIEKLINS